MTLIIPIPFSTSIRKSLSFISYRKNCGKVTSIFPKADVFNEKRRRTCEFFVKFIRPPVLFYIGQRFIALSIIGPVAVSIFMIYAPGANAVQSMVSTVFPVVCPLCTVLPETPIISTICALSGNSIFNWVSNIAGYAFAVCFSIVAVEAFLSCVSFSSILLAPSVSVSVAVRFLTFSGSLSYAITMLSTVIPLGALVTRHQSASHSIGV